MRKAWKIVVITICGWSFSLASAQEVPPYCPPGAPQQFAAASPGFDTNPGGWPPSPDNGPWTTPQAMANIPQVTHEPHSVYGFFRSEWLTMRVKEPGPALLGSGILGVDNPAEPFPVIDDTFSTIGEARVGSLAPVKFNGITGVRNTFGFEYENGGMVEFSAYVTENAVQRIGNTELTDTNMYATSVLINGNVSDGQDAFNLFFYNRSFLARYSSRIWGSDLNFISAPSEFLFLEVRPLAGLRYINVYEKIQQRGTFEPLFVGDTVDSAIDTWAYNNVIAGQIGVRVESVGKYFTLGVEPKFGMGPNIAMAKVRTDHLRGITDGEFFSNDKTMGLATIWDLNAYLRWHATDNLTFSVGYNYTYVDRVIRGSTATFYNDTGDLNLPPGVVAVGHKSDIWMRGVTLGMELKW